jgi:chromatin remodeling complex protein RSC6
MGKQKKPSAFMKPVQVTDTLAEITGPGPMARTEVTKRVWDYIKKHNLQSRTNRRMIEPDNKLAKVFGSSQPIDMFKMTSKVAKHIKDTETAGSHR